MEGVLGGQESDLHGYGVCGSDTSLWALVLPCKLTVIRRLQIRGRLGNMLECFLKPYFAIFEDLNSSPSTFS